ncbi:membrane-bound transcription factor site-1 protease [Clonorchis sinensis]|uniref:Membrane-bound transcription factor site-1 protease n=1 Tax=Clonorchis sinensis TaxID=79923 RepID=G7YBG9_CLOSI|nr:membrane-bound transcription factor site-1 protease [Clonorchis sinensis]
MPGSAVYTGSPLCMLMVASLCFYCSIVLSDQTYEYSVNSVVNEFIVSYHTRTFYRLRTSLLCSILDRFYLNYSILPRWSSIPIAVSSDFDVVVVHNLTERDSSSFVASLERHPLIKGAYQQKRIQRILLEHERGAEASDRRTPKLFGKQWKPPVPGTIPLHETKQPWRLLQVERLWARGVCGADVRVGIFDTGLVDTTKHPHFHATRVVERTDWTKSESSDVLRAVDSNRRSHLQALDGHGHGTFVAGLIAAAQNSPPSLDQFVSRSSGSSGCPPVGLAPWADLFIFRVFTDQQVSYTSWFLDAFNYAISRKLHVINLSIGGPDFLDRPFVDKVWELSSNGILLVSAIGNDGPVFGSLNNPADQMDVLGVGGVDALGRIAQFSSRGMTAWSLPFGYGQVKPDVVSFSTGVISSGLDGKCRTLSGTSVASPIVAGVVALLISAALDQNSRSLSDHSIPSVPINPASLKQALIAGATPLSRIHLFGTEPIQWPNSPDSSSMFEQGAGLVDLRVAFQTLQHLKPQATIIPSYLDFTECPYMWPYCSQPFYHTMQPVVVNLTILNSMAVSGHIVGAPVYHPYSDRNGNRLRVGFTYNKHLWPWSGYLAVHFEVASELNDSVPSDRFSGLAEGYITLTVESEDELTKTTLWTNLTVPVRAQIIPTPNRSRRILYDQFHSIHYPSGYIPRDDLTRKNQPLDWLGDHIHTNMRDLYTHLRSSNYYVEVLTSPFTCFDARNYGTLLLVDPEEEFFPQEIEKLFDDVTTLGLSLLTFADWYNTSVINALRFFDTNTKRLWTPETGGVNLPALNELLRPFGVEMGDKVYAGSITIGRRTIRYTSGSSLKKFPSTQLSSTPGRGGLLRPSLVDIGAQVIQNRKKPGTQEESVAKVREVRQSQETVNMPDNWRLTATENDPTPAVLGLWTATHANSSTGRLAVYGDSDCLSSTHLNANCFWLVDALLQFATSPFARIPRLLADQMVPVTDAMLDSEAGVPERLKDSNLHKISNVLRRDGPPPVELPNGSLPREAYRLDFVCPRLPSGLTVAAPHNPESRLIYEPQPLLLHAPVPKDIFPLTDAWKCRKPRGFQTGQEHHNFQYLFICAVLVFTLSLLYRWGPRRVNLYLVNILYEFSRFYAFVVRRLYTFGVGIQRDRYVVLPELR